MAVRLRPDDGGRGDATLRTPYAGARVLGLAALGVALLAIAGDSLPAVITGLALILLAAILAMRGTGPT